MTPREHPPVDVFETFAERVDVGAKPGLHLPATGALARRAGLTLGVMMLVGVAFVLGFALAARAHPDLEYTNLFWEGLAKFLWAAGWGVLAAALTLAAAALAIGVPWARRQAAEGSATAARRSSGRGAAGR